MSKSVLVIDTPEKCNVLCPCYSSDLVGSYCKAIRDDKGWCRPARKISDYNDYKTKKPDWCPLTPLPEYKDLTSYVSRGDAKSITHAILYSYAQGYNDCIRDIQERRK